MEEKKTKSPHIPFWEQKKRQFKNEELDELIIKLAMAEKYYNTNHFCKLIQKKFPKIGFYKISKRISKVMDRNPELIPLFRSEGTIDFFNRNDVIESVYAYDLRENGLTGLLQELKRLKSQDDKFKLDYAQLRVGLDYLDIQILI